MPLLFISILVILICNKCHLSKISSSKKMEHRPALTAGYPWSLLARVECPNFGHSVLNSQFTKHKFLQMKIVLQQLWMNWQYWNYFSFRKMIRYFHSMPTASTKCVNLEWRSWGRVSEVRAHYPIWPHLTSRLGSPVVEVQATPSTPTARRSRYPTLMEEPTFEKELGVYKVPYNLIFFPKIFVPLPHLIFCPTALIWQGR